MNICGMNSNGMQLGDFKQEQSQENNDLKNENDWNRCGDNEGENGNSDMEEEGKPNDNTQGTNAERNQPVPLSFGHNIHASAKRNLFRAISQESRTSLKSTRCDWGFLKNMNNNMQGMLFSLIIMIQKNQERAEERNRRQMERYEEQHLQEERRCVEYEAC
ncbi:hypothetical protein O181_097571 [Austropuccinia psidii MF-1]|uniref:Uncharacterized protein n=1 Tax=Austropuccinia psidii MF-1 TaxID=1389203 RepID=A0A9Q3PF76_9BASI|nr:hypothetical protein [Austropuccinia psidii MF-1]